MSNRNYKLWEAIYASDENYKTICTKAKIHSFKMGRLVNRQAEATPEEADAIAAVLKKTPEEIGLVGTSVEKPKADKKKKDNPSTKT